ncbi:hypothetical protein KUTeg_017584 [Tegillarca granosa]|uniref:Uncharacterized protein n=1 Tax=Tegillarca granosa TaxID=220873 RepID=A0ABQ9EJE2_TEGGR|nr:hypothetical protein KUTeg_017584 [Tegillarca granosa]
MSATELESMDGHMSVREKNISKYAHVKNDNNVFISTSGFDETLTILLYDQNGYRCKEEEVRNFN